ncbi:MAG: hypothetical protein II208_00410 [Alphaproteobacteria bacterium]|nr:hypothetical protein [Alphaproteobacteria bacterium]
MEQMNLQITQTAQPTFTVEVVQNLVPVIAAQVLIGGGTANIKFGDTMTGTGTPADPINVSNTVLQQISDNAEQGAENASQISDIQNTLSNVQDDIQNATEQISDIQSVIPATANSENQLADQGFVNSSIQTATAYFRGDWATWADVPSDPSLYPVDATGNRTPTTNDYMVVITDEQTNGGTWRYKYTGLWSEQGKSGWQAEYQVNETPFTAAQNAALNSGVTAQAVADIATNKSNITALQNGKQDKLTAGDGITIDGTTISATGGGGASLPDQTGNAGKFLTTDGTTVSWGEALVNGTTVLSGLAIGGTVTKNGSTAIGQDSSSSGYYSVLVGAKSSVSAGGGIAIGYGAKVTASGAIILNSSSNIKTNADANTFKIVTQNGNFEMMDANGNVPLGRLTYVTDQIGDISTALTAILGE